MARMRAFACDNDMCDFLTKDEHALAYSAKIKGPHADQGRTVRTHSAVCLVVAVAQDVGVDWPEVIEATYTEPLAADKAE